MNPVAATNLEDVQLSLEATLHGLERDHILMLMELMVKQQLGSHVSQTVGVAKGHHAVQVML